MHHVVKIGALWILDNALKRCVCTKGRFSIWIFFSLLPYFRRIPLNTYIPDLFGYFEFFRILAYYVKWMSNIVYRRAKFEIDRKLCVWNICLSISENFRFQILLSHNWQNNANITTFPHSTANTRPYTDQIQNKYFQVLSYVAEYPSSDSVLVCTLHTPLIHSLIVDQASTYPIMHTLLHFSATLSFSCTRPCSLFHIQTNQFDIEMLQVLREWRHDSSSCSTRITIRVSVCMFTVRDCFVVNALKCLYIY